MLCREHTVQKKRTVKLHPTLDFPLIPEVKYVTVELKKKRCLKNGDPQTNKCQGHWLSRLGVSSFYSGPSR